MGIEEEKSNDDIFTEAFDRLAETGEAPAPVAPEPETSSEAAPAAEETVAAAEEAPVDGADVLEDAPAGDEQVPAETVGEAKPKQAAPDKPAPEQDIIDRLAQAVKERVQPQPQPDPQPQYAQDYQPQPVLTQEDYKTLEAFDKDWPDVSKAINLILKEQTNAVVNHVFKEFAQEFRPFAQEVRSMRAQTHMAELHNRVSDYDDVRDKVVEWAMQQPPYLRAAYGHVIQNGTAEEVADLIGRYRASVAPPPAPVAPVAPQPKQLSPQVKKAAAALAPVQSKRSTVVQGNDPNDFEGAFSRFADMM